MIAWGGQRTKRGLSLKKASCNPPGRALNGRAWFLNLTETPMPVVTNTHALPADLHAQNVQTNGTTLYVRTGGHGPSVVLLHGYGETGDMWASMATDLVRDHQVVVPDLRGLGLSSKPPGGFDKKTQAGDLAGVLADLGVDQIDLVAHDIGNMVAFQVAAQHPERVR
jgi:pimeloyl-ACP methyl ester carboxylesterase